MDKTHNEIANRLLLEENNDAWNLKKIQDETAKELLLKQMAAAIDLKTLHYSMDEEENHFHSTVAELLKKQQLEAAILYKNHYEK